MRDKDKKPFNETGFGKFLNRAKGVIPNVANIVGKVATGNIGGAIEEVSELLNKGAKDSIEAQALLQELEIKRIQFENELVKINLENIKDARDMQKIALQQDDLFSKRFIYYLAAFVSIAALVVVVMLFFIEVPEENKRIVDMVIGIFIGTGFIQVLNFFFGSSKGSKDKHDILHKIN